MHIRSACRSLYRAAAVLLTTAVAGGSMTLLSTTAAHADPSSPSGWCSASWSPNLLTTPGSYANLSVSAPATAFGMEVVDGHLAHTGGYDTYYTNGVAGQTGSWNYETVANGLVRWGATTPTLGIRIYNLATTDWHTVTDATPYDCETSVTLDRLPHPGPQTITINPIGHRSLSDQRFNLPATSSSGDLLFTSDTSDVCVSMMPQVYLVGTGICTLSVQARGNWLYLPASTSISFRVATASLAHTVTIDPIATHRLGDAPVSLSAISAIGLPVSFTSTTPEVCTVTDDRATLLTAGTCTVQADAPDDDTHVAGTKRASFAVVAPLLAQTVTVDPIAGHRLGDSPVNVTASSTSGLPVTLSSTDLLKCTVAGNAVTLVAIGTCTLQADVAGNSTYLPGTTEVSFPIDAALLAQSVTVDPIAGHRLGDSPFNVTASSTSGLPVTLSSTDLLKCTVAGNAVTLVAIGTCTLQADVAGNSTYLPGTTQASFPIGAAPSASTLRLTGPAGVALSTGQVTVHSSSTSPLPVTTVTTTPSVCSLSGSTVRLRAAGRCTLRATQSGNADHLAPAPATLSFPVWAAPALPNTGQLAQVLTALGQGESALRVTGTGGACVTASGGRVVLTKPGSCTILVRNASGALLRAHRTLVAVGKPAAGLRQSASVYFSFNSAALTADGKRALAAAVPALRHSSLVVVYGHTDGPAGNSPSSMTLSTQRASAVASFLRNAGVGAHFELVPLAHQAPAGTAAAKNRRAEVFYLPSVS